MMGKVLFMRKGETHAVPVGAILASDIAVGSTVKLIENGNPVEYLVVHSGLPSSAYDSSCDGLWLLRKELHSSRTWDATDADYANSDINTWLNNTFYNALGSIEQSVIKQVKIPYCSTVGKSMDKAVISTGSSGFATKVFLLTECEVGITSGYSELLYVGAKLSYFGTSNSKRIGYLNGTATDWWLRVPCYNAGWGTYAAGVSKTGALVNTGLVSNYSKGVRPCVVLPITAIFDADTLVLKGTRSTKNISVSVTDAYGGESALLGTKGSLTVGGYNVTTVTAEVATVGQAITIEYELTGDIGAVRNVVVNGTLIGSVHYAGDSVSTTINVSDGDTIAIEFQK